MPGPYPIIDVNAPEFSLPCEMPQRIMTWLRERDMSLPKGQPQLVRWIVESLAEAFAKTVHEAIALSGRSVKTVHLVGGGARNRLLGQAIACRSDLPAVAGPVEATTIGNLLIQAQSLTAIPASLETLRDVAERSTVLRQYQPTKI